MTAWSRIRSLPTVDGAVEPSVHERVEAGLERVRPGLLADGGAYVPFVGARGGCAPASGYRWRRRSK